MTDPFQSEDGPPLLDEETLVSHLVDADGLFLGVDFDGTITDIAASPDDPVTPPATRQALRQLSNHQCIHVAIISGRALSDLREHVGIEGITYAGNHGLELRRDGETTVNPVAEQRRPLIQTLLDNLQDRLAHIDGCFIENKNVTASIHYRQVDEHQVEELTTTVQSAVSELTPDRITTRPGKAVIELRPSIPHDKGTIVKKLTTELDSDCFSLYFGDDTTDEDVFQLFVDEVDGLGVHVGDDTTTDADRRVPSPDAVKRTLLWLTDNGIEHLQ